MPKLSMNEKWLNLSGICLLLVFIFFVLFTFYIGLLLFGNTTFSERKKKLRRKIYACKEDYNWKWKEGKLCVGMYYHFWIMHPTNLPSWVRYPKEKGFYFYKKDYFSSISRIFYYTYIVHIMIFFFVFFSIDIYRNQNPVLKWKKKEFTMN